MGNNSFTAICRGKRDFVHKDANHFNPNTVKNPNKLESSVYKRVTSEDYHKSGRRTDFSIHFFENATTLPKLALTLLLKRISKTVLLLLMSNQLNGVKKKTIPGNTTKLAKFNSPIKD